MSEYFLDNPPLLPKRAIDLIFLFFANFKTSIMFLLFPEVALH